VNEVVTLGDLRLQVRRSARRRTVELTVERDGLVRVDAPVATELARIERFVHDKRMWLYTKLARKASLRDGMLARELVSGESFWYLGRSHRLEIVRTQAVPLRLAAGKFQLRRDAKTSGWSCFEAWYTRRAYAWIGPRVERLASRFAVKPEGVEVRGLGHRWGSCGARGVVNFHWATVMLPPSAIEYVIVHELAHLQEQHHTPAFWRLVERAMPEYEGRKRWLAERGGEFVGW
jgi:predicted metal-dependent hydrolase